LSEHLWQRRSSTCRRRTQCNALAEIQKSRTDEIQNSLQFNYSLLTLFLCLSPGGPDSFPARSTGAVKVCPAGLPFFSF
jgi:hypothetical protein